MRIVSVLVLLTGGLASCAGRPSTSIPFNLTPSVEQTLADWRAAGMTCGEPEIGMPGPAADWQCDATLEGVQVGIRLIADRFGVQSIHVGVVSATDRASAARAFASVVEATSMLDPAQAQVTEWLLANGAADGELPGSSPPLIGRAAVDSTEPGVTMLYLIPIESSMMSAWDPTGSLA